jgi:glycosyltransferase 2 family protein
VIARLTGSIWFRALLTAAVLAYLASTIDLGDTARALAKLSPLAAIAVLALLAIDRAVIIWRWIILIRATGQRVAAKSAAWIYLVSSFIGSFTPGGIGGDAARAYTLTQRTSQASDAVASIAMDRVLGLFSLLLVGLAGAVAWGRQTGRPASILLLTAAAGASGCVALLWADRWVRAALPERLRSRGIGLRFTRMADAISQYRDQRRAIAAVLLLSIGLQLLRIVQAYLLGTGIGIDVPFSYYLVFMPIGLIGLLLPISVGGFGLPQGFIVALLQTQAVGKPEALALSTLIVLTGLLANLPGAWLYLRSRQPRA